MVYHVGDRVRLKKKHPVWELYVGDNASGGRFSHAM